MNAALIDDLADDSNHPIPIIGTLDIEGVRKGGGADLVIVVAAPLRSDSRSRNRLVKKFEAYLSYIASTAFSANGGIPTPDNTSIIVYIHPDSDREMIGLIESCRGWIHDNHARLEIKTLANQLSHPTPASDTPPVEQEPRLRGRG